MVTTSHLNKLRLMLTLVAHCRAVDKSGAVGINCLGKVICEFMQKFLNKDFLNRTRLKGQNISCLNSSVALRSIIWQLISNAYV